MRFIAPILMMLSILPNTAGKAYASDPNENVPPGFENLDVDRSLVLDMHYRGKKLGTVQVTLSASKFRFDEPANVAALLPLDRSEASLALERDFASNVDRVCSRLSSLDCGLLRTDDFAFIIDEENFRIDAFIGNRFLLSDHANHFLRPSQEGPSVTTVLDGSVSGINGSADYYLQSESIVSFGNTRAIAVGAVSSYNSFLTREALVEMDHDSLRSKAGLFWVPTNDFLGRRRLIGIGTQSQSDTLSNREQNLGTPLEIALPERSRVDVFEGDRLLWTGFFPAGFATIDTRAFPDGAYPVTLQITNSSGEKREEPRFFVKDANLPAIGEGKFHAFVGLVGETSGLGTSFEDILLTVGYSKRMNNALALGGSLVASERGGLAELNLDFATDSMRSRASLLIGNSGQIGIASTFSLRPRRNFSLNLTGRKLWTDGQGPILPSESYDLAAPFPSSDTLKLNGSYTQIVASVSQRVGKGNLRVHGIYTDTPHSKAVYSVGPAFDYPIINGPAGSLQFSANVNQSSGNSSAFVGLRFFKSTGASAISGRLGVAHESRNGSTSGSKGIDVVGDVNVATRRSIGNYDLLGSAGLSREFYGHDARAELEMQSAFMAARGSILQNIDGLNGQTQYSASFRTAIGASERAFVLTGRNYDRSAINIEIDAPSDGEFEVYVDDRLIGKANGQESLAIFLTPYRVYEVSVRNIGRQQFLLDQSSQSVTLFPGNVAEIAFKARLQFSLFGRVVDKTGTPISNQMLRSNAGIGQSDEDGYFQLEVLKSDSIIMGSKGIMQCAVPPIENDNRSAFRRVGNITCD